MKDQTIYLLIGPKGSGKTFIGTLLDQHFGIRFIRVEDWARTVKRGQAIDDNTYLKEVFETIEQGIREELIRNVNVVFESTGLTVYFDQMIRNLRSDFPVVSIRVMADQALCLSWVKARDQSIHINVSDEQVNRINQQVRAKDMRGDYTIQNNDQSENQLLEVLKTIVKR